MDIFGGSLLNFPLDTVHIFFTFLSVNKSLVVEVIFYFLKYLNTSLNIFSEAEWMIHYFCGQNHVIRQILNGVVNWLWVKSQKRKTFFSVSNSSSFWRNVHFSKVSTIRGWQVDVKMGLQLYNHRHAWSSLLFMVITVKSIIVVAVINKPLQFKARNFIYMIYCVRLSPPFLQMRKLQLRIKYPIYSARKWQSSLEISGLSSPSAESFHLTSLPGQVLLLFYIRENEATWPGWLTRWFLSWILAY